MLTSTELTCKGQKKRLEQRLDSIVLEIECWASNHWPIYVFVSTTVSSFFYFYKSVALKIVFDAGINVNEYRKGAQSYFEVTKHFAKSLHKNISVIS